MRTATCMVLGALMMLGGARGAHAQGGSSVEPPKFTPAPVSAEKVKKVTTQQSTLVDPFETAQTTPSMGATGASTPGTVAPTMPSPGLGGTTSPAANTPSPGSAATAPAGVSPATSGSIGVPSATNPSSVAPSPVTTPSAITVPGSGTSTGTMTTTPTQTPSTLAPPTPTTPVPAPATPGFSAPSMTPVSPSSTTPAIPSTTPATPATPATPITPSTAPSTNPSTTSPTGTPPADNGTSNGSAGNPGTVSLAEPGVRPGPPAPSQYEDLKESEPTVAQQAPPARPRWQDPDIALQVGGGVMNFSSTQMQDLTQTGGYWDVRLVLGLRRIFAAELAYVGTLNPITAPGVAEGSRLYGHGVEGALRVNAPLITREGAYVLPYAMAGLGWQSYHVSGSTDGRVLTRSDDVVSVPLGGGVTIGYRHLYLDTRFVYRLTENEDLLAADPHSSNQLRQWTFGGNFGFLF